MIDNFSNPVKEMCIRDSIEGKGEKKNQIMEKTEEKKMKIRRIIRPKKIRITPEILEMTRGGLINSINHPIIDDRIMANGKKYDKNLVKAFEVNHQVTGRRIFTKRVVRVNTPRKKYSSTDQ